MEKVQESGCFNLYSPPVLSVNQHPPCSFYLCPPFAALKLA